MKYYSDDYSISQITGWIRKSAKILANKTEDRSAELKTITDKLWISAIDMKNRKFKGTPDGFEYNIHEVALFILICDGLFLRRLYEPFEQCLHQLRLHPIVHLKQLYSQVKCIGQYPFFGSLIVELMPEHDEALDSLMVNMFCLISEIFDKNDHDILGKIFNELIPSEIRRRMGAFFTTDVYAALLTMLSISRFDVKVLDLSCGTGCLLNEALMRKMELFQLQKDLKENQTSLGNQKRTFAANKENSARWALVSDMFGCDILQYSTSLAWLNLMNRFLKNAPFESIIQSLKENRDALANIRIPNINVFMIDGLSIAPNVPFSHFVVSVAEKRHNGCTDLMKGTIPLVDIILMNPPFSMSRSMDSDLKRVLIERMAKLGLESYIDKNMGLHGYFILYSDQFLSKGGNMALIIPASTFDSDYSEPLIRFLKDRNYSIDYLIEILSESSAFSFNCSFKELIFIGTKGALTDDSTTRLVSITKDLDYSDLAEVCHSIVHEKSSNLARIKRVQTAKLYEKGHWIRFFDEDYSVLENLFRSGHFRKFREMPSLKLIRGFDGTYLEFVCIPNKFWTVQSEPSSHETSIDKEYWDSEHIPIIFSDPASKGERHASKPVCIPRKYLLPSIRSSKYIPGIVGPPTHFVFNVSEDLLADRDFESIKTHYFDVCTELMLNKWIEKTKNGHYQRDPPEDWFRHPNRNHCSKTVGHIVHLYKYSFLTRSSVVVYCPTEITVSNGFGYVIQTPDDEFYMAWFSSTLYLYALCKNQKSYSKGFFKVMVESLSKVYVPSCPEFPTDAIKVKQAYRELSSKQNLPSLKTQIENRFSERVSLDRAWLEFLGHSGSDIDMILDTLYKYCGEVIRHR